MAKTIFFGDKLDEKENCVYLKTYIIKVTKGDTVFRCNTK